MTICSCPRHDTNGYLTSRVWEDGNNYGIVRSEAGKRTAILDINVSLSLSLFADLSLFKKIKQVAGTHKIIHVSRQSKIGVIANSKQVTNDK